MCAMLIPQSHMVNPAHLFMWPPPGSLPEMTPTATADTFNMVVPADVHLLHLRVSTWRARPVSYPALGPRAYHKAQPRK